MTEDESKTRFPGYQLFMLVLCVYALAALAAQTAIRLEPGTKSILDYADYAVCGVFLLDFFISLVRAPNRWQYFLRWGWLDLLSSIPTIDIVRWGRAARILRLFRVLRGLRATKVLATLVLRRRAESTFLAASLVAMLLIVFCSIAVLHFETDADSNIKTPDDAIWWAFATITTVGYGDRYPVTGEGRLIATILMAAGVGLFGTFSGFLAAWFLGSGEEQPNDELTALHKEVAAVRVTLERIAAGREGLTTPRGGMDPEPSPGSETNRLVEANAVDSP
jgi:voltage-gated potassium channel